MNLFFHICCGPCFIYPYFDLKEDKGIKIMGFFYNNNIHPYREYKKRLGTLINFSQKEKVDVIFQKEYGLNYFLENIPYKNGKEERCRACYMDRMIKTVKDAKKNNANAFTTTMLYSPFQDHEYLKELCSDLSQEYDIEFYYKDWRPFYKEGVELAKKFDLYRQGYCGCVFSEQERYNKVFSE